MQAYMKSVMPYLGVPMPVVRRIARAAERERPPASAGAVAAAAKVRRDRADVFATLAEGIKGKRAVEWGLVDAVMPRSRFAAAADERALALAAAMAISP